MPKYPMAYVRNIVDMSLDTFHVHVFYGPYDVKFDTNRSVIKEYLAYCSETHAWYEFFNVHNDFTLYLDGDEFPW